MGISASVIAFASGRGLPVSTTYVAFAAVLGTGLSDRVFERGDADRKIGRAIWVVTCWFLAPVIAVVATGCVATLVYQVSTAGLILCVFLNLGVRYLFKMRADRHEKQYHKEIAKQLKEIEKAEKAQQKAKEAGEAPATDDDETEPPQMEPLAEPEPAGGSK